MKTADPRGAALEVFISAAGDSSATMEAGCTAEQAADPNPSPLEGEM
jgi:hypothetical protein